MNAYEITCNPLNCSDTIRLLVCIGTGRSGLRRVDCEKNSDHTPAFARMAGFWGGGGKCVYELSQLLFSNTEDDSLDRRLRGPDEGCV